MLDGIPLGGAWGIVADGDFESEPIAKSLAKAVLPGCAASNIVCWGTNATGILNPDFVANPYYTVPTTVSLGLPTGLTVKEVIASPSSKALCTIVSDGSLMCWGDNNSL